MNKVTKVDGSDFEQSDEGIMIYGNEGTLRAEQPMYFEFMFALDLVKARRSTAS